MNTAILAQLTYTTDEVLSPYVYVFYAAFIVSFLFTPVMRRIATYYNIIDKPDLTRKMHLRPVAYLGGVAVFLGWLAGLTASQYLYMHRDSIGLSPTVLIRANLVIGAMVIVLLGLWDDLSNIPPKVKISGQIAAAAMLIMAGVGTRSAVSLLTPVAVRLPDELSSVTRLLLNPTFAYLCSCAIVVAVIVFCCNAANLMDGLDGLCGGVTAIVALGFVILAVHLGRQGSLGNTNVDAVRVVIGLALLGGVLGFVPFNFNPASIFMGDAGSMFLGFCCGVMILLMADQGSKWFLAAMVMFALPVLDTTLAFARRSMAGRPIFSADKMHFHHQLVQRGLTVRKAVLVAYSLAVAFVLLGTSIVIMRTRYAVALYLVIFGFIIVAAYKMGMIHERPLVISRPRPLDPNSIAPQLQSDNSSVLEVREDEKQLPGETPQSV